MPNPTPMGTVPSTSSPNILEWVLVVLMVVTIAGLGYLYLTLTQLSDSVTATKADVMTVKSEVMAQKEVMMEKGAMETDAEMEADPTAGWLTYSSEEYTFRYPPTYTVTAPTDLYHVLTLAGEHGKFELWNRDEIEERPIDFGDSEPSPEEFEDAIPEQEWDIRVPRTAVGSQLFHYTVRFFYSENTARDELQRIANTIQ